MRVAGAACWRSPGWSFVWCHGSLASRRRRPRVLGRLRHRCRRSGRCPTRSRRRRPSISADGRWVVFSGMAGDRRSVFRTDRTNEHDDRAVAGAGRRAARATRCIRSCRPTAASSWRSPRSPSTCSATTTATTDGTSTGWSSPSAAGSRTGGSWSRPPSAPASPATTCSSIRRRRSPGRVPRSPTSIRPRVHPTGVATISIVDITVPINETGRVQQVAGMPAEAPGGAFLYRGARDPVISQNGRHLGVRLRHHRIRRAARAGATGPVVGELRHVAGLRLGPGRRRPASRRAVDLGPRRRAQRRRRSASPTCRRTAGSWCSARATARWCPPTSRNCTPDCPSQMYRFDRDTDRNGIFDEPPRRPQLALVSAVDAGVVDVGLPVGRRRPVVVAGGQRRRQPDRVRHRRHQPAAEPARRRRWRARDGDLLVAEFQLGQIRRVLDGSDTTGVPGAHGNPALSKTGQVIAFDTMAASAIAGRRRHAAATGRAVVTVEATPQLSLAALDFGTVLLGFESTELYAKVLNSGPAAFEPTAVESSSPNFKITGGTCIRGVIVAAGSSCSVNLTFNPTAPRAFSGTLTVRGVGAGGPSASDDAPRSRRRAGDAGRTRRRRLRRRGGRRRWRTGWRSTSRTSGSFRLGSSRLEIIGGTQPRRLPDHHRGVHAPSAQSRCELRRRGRVLADRRRLSQRAAGRRRPTTGSGAGRTRPPCSAASPGTSPSFAIAEPTARPGEQFLIGGSGFPANSVSRSASTTAARRSPRSRPAIDGTFLGERSRCRPESASGRGCWWPPARRAWWPA